jgi:hypothetical protein
MRPSRAGVSVPYGCNGVISTAPVLSVNLITHRLEWVWASVNPYQWQVDRSTDSGVTWNLFTDYNATLRGSTGNPPNGQYRLYGADISNNPTTPFSNIVTI